MDTNPNHLIQTVLINALPALLAITLHAAAHGYAARYFGDDSAALQQRISLNPFKHIDPVGTILMPLLLYFVTAGAFLLGYARPVPVDFSRLRNPKTQMIWVSLAGPAANLVQAVGWALLLIVLKGFGVDEFFFLSMAGAGVGINLALWAFNLFPLPPLPGGRILIGLLPVKQARMLARLEPWGLLIVMGLTLAGVVGPLWLRPLMVLSYAAVRLLLTPLEALAALAG